MLTRNAELAYIASVNHRTSALFLLLMFGLIYTNPIWPQASQPTPSQPGRILVPSAEMGKLLVKRIPPEYPAKARSKGIEGTVMLRAVVSKSGDVVDVTVMSGDPELSKAAMNAAKKWKYHAYLVGGEPTEVETTIQMNFQLAR